MAAGSALPTYAARPSHISGPVVQVLGHPTPSAPPSHSQAIGLDHALGATSGYTVNHISYQVAHTKMASNAYAGNAGQVILVKVHVVHLPERKTKPILIGVSFEYDSSLSLIANH